MDFSIFKISKIKTLLTRNYLVAYNKFMDKIFKALADKTRRKLLDELYINNGLSLNELCKNMDMSRQAVTKHLNILEEANLITIHWKGREKLHYLNPLPIQEIYERWIGKYERKRLDILSQLKKDLEESKDGYD